MIEHTSSPRQIKGNDRKSRSRVRGRISDKRRLMERGNSEHSLWFDNHDHGNECESEDWPHDFVRDEVYPGTDNDESSSSSMSSLVIQESTEQRRGGRPRSRRVRKQRSSNRRVVMVRTDSSGDLSNCSNHSNKTCTTAVEKRLSSRGLAVPTAERQPAQQRRSSFKMTPTRSNSLRNMRTLSDEDLPSSSSRRGMARSHSVGRDLGKRSKPGNGTSLLGSARDDDDEEEACLLTQWSVDLTTATAFSA